MIYDLQYELHSQLVGEIWNLRNWEAKIAMFDLVKQIQRKQLLVLVIRRCEKSMGWRNQDSTVLLLPLDGTLVHHRSFQYFVTYCTCSNNSPDNILLGGQRGTVRVNLLAKEHTSQSSILDHSHTPLMSQRNSCISYHV